MPTTRTKTDVVQAVADKLGSSKKHAALVTNSILDILKDTLASGEDVLITGFGKFSVNQKGPRKGRNPSTGQEIMIGPRRVVAFKYSDKLKEKVNPPDEEAPVETPAFEFEQERRAEPRNDKWQHGTATVRVSGIPVYKFEVKDVSERGNCFLVDQESAILRNVEVDQEIEIRINALDDPSKTVVQRSKIVHISKADDFGFQGYFMLGVQVLNTLTL